MIGDKICPYAPGGKGKVLRSALIKRVKALIPSMQSPGCILYGQRRIGKTTLLQQLHAELPAVGDLHTVEFDLQDKIDESLDDIIPPLAKKIHDSLAGAAHGLGLPTNEKAFREDFIPQVRARLRSKKLVLLFDEFDAVVPHLPSEQPHAAEAPERNARHEEQVRREANARHLLAGLERLMTGNTWLYLVFVVGRHVGDFEYIDSQADATSKFFRNFQLIHVSTMSREETAELVQASRVGGSMAWDPLAEQRVWDYTNGHPLLVQALCQQVWERLVLQERRDRPVATVAHVDQAVKPALEEWNGALEWLWKGLSPACKVTASALAQMPRKATREQVKRALQDSGVRVIGQELITHAPKLLKEWDLIEESEAGYYFRVDLIHQWIRKNKPLSEVQKYLDEINPVAENLYKAAEGLKRANRLDDALQRAVQALAENPHHGKALALIADIHVRRGQFVNAEKHLLQLMEVQPAIGRTKMIDLLDRVAESESSSEKRLEIYNRILELDPTLERVRGSRDEILRTNGEQAFSRGEYEVALGFFEAIKEKKRIEDTKVAIRARECYQLLEQLKQYEATRRFTDVLVLVNERSGQFPELADQLTTISRRIESKATCDDTVAEALKLASEGERDRAFRLILDVAQRDREYPKLGSLIDRITNPNRLGTYARTAILAVVLIGTGVAIGALASDRTSEPSSGPVAARDEPRVCPPALSTQFRDALAMVVKVATAAGPSPTTPGGSAAASIAVDEGKAEPARSSPPAASDTASAIGAPGETKAEPVGTIPPASSDATTAVDKPTKTKAGSVKTTQPSASAADAKTDPGKTTPNKKGDAEEKPLTCDEWKIEIRKKVVAACDSDIADYRRSGASDKLHFVCQWSDAGRRPRCVIKHLRTTYVNDCVEGLTNWGVQLSKAPPDSCVGDVYIQGVG